MIGFREEAILARLGTLNAVPVPAKVASGKSSKSSIQSASI